MSSLVSIIMPCYNAGKYVTEAVCSVLEQTHRDLELITVNDCSADNTLEILQSLAAKDPRMRVVALSENAGQAAAANSGLAVARGKYVKFFDADDVMAPKMLEAQLKRLKGRDDCVASAEWGRFYDDDLSTYTPSKQSVWRDMDARDWLVESWMNARPMMQCGLWLIPRVLLEKTGGWDERLSLINDFEFFARVLCASQQVLFTPDCPMHYRSGIAGSLSGTKSEKAIESAYLSASKGVDHLLAKRSDERAKKSCANIMQDFAYTFYPARPDLTIQAERRARELGGADVEPGGGRKFHLARRILGWKTARRLVG